MDKLALDYFNAIADRRPSNLKAEVLSDILDRLAWTTENGGGVGAILDDWIMDEDPYKVEVAVLQTQFLPNGPPERLLARLAYIKTWLPHLAENCENICMQLTPAGD